MALVAPAAISRSRSARPPRLTTQSASGIAMSISTRNASAGQDKRRRQRAQEHRQHWLGLREAVPEIALEDARDRRDVADGQGVIEPVRLSDALDGLG